MSIDGVNVICHVGLHTFSGILDVCKISTYGLRPLLFQHADKVKVPNLFNKLNQLTGAISKYKKKNAGRLICISKGNISMINTI